MRIYRILGAIIGLLSLASCGHHEEHHHEKLHLPVTHPLRKDTSTTRNYVTRIHSVRHIELRALEKGYLQHIHVDEGQRVHKGQLMFEIMPNLYEAELNRAKAEAEFAEIEYQNTAQLAANNVVAPNELALSKAKLDKALAELSLAQVHLDFTQVRAPFNGIMDHFHVREGSLVEEGELLTTLSDNHEMWAYFNVPEAEYLSYQRNVQKDTLLEVNLELADGTIFDYPGHVTTIEADFNSETGNIAFRATFPNPEGLLRHGETGNILVKRPLNNVLLIPQKATYEVLSQHYVFVIDQEDHVRARRIDVAGELPYLYAVTAGLEATDRILLEGLRKVREGDHIHPEFIEASKVLGSLELYAE